MARKKVVLVIVEGVSDEDALSIVFTKFYERYSKNVLVKVMHGDITTEWSNCSQNIREKITKVVKQHTAVNKFKKEDYEQIIHIVDTDGAFID
ncbi:MAG: hypothetical protein K2K16_04775 [Ruminococcus sp.]|nr:hypothetical protein [Ruminococcus sp.]